MYVVLSTAPGGVVAHRFDDDGAIADEPEFVESDDFVEWADLENDDSRPRWVWSDSRAWYPQLLAAGVRVARCHDLRLCHNILRASVYSAQSRLALGPASAWDSPVALDVESFSREEPGSALFDLAVDEPSDDLDPVEEFLLQREAIATSSDPNRISLLLAAESAGALVAVEIKHAGLPWNRDRHAAMLEEVLGPRPRGGERPQKLDELYAEMRARLDNADFNPDSPVEVLKVLRRTGLAVDSTRSWDLKKLDHPVIAPLLAYKKLSRLASSNGWHWLDTWVADGRFRPDYVPGGAATGRWGANGGGALQLPKDIRGAVIADPGWKLVVADASQLEPRILSAMSADRRMAEAGKGDLYEGIVASGAVATRADAKLAMLGAMYGATSGESGRLMPRLAQAFPQAIALVEQAARAGERGEIVATQLGRSSPRPPESWWNVQRAANLDAASEARARSAARSWGRFTRNFIVQGTAAEWALSWMADLRNRLFAIGDGELTDKPHLVFFLHDEVIVHSPVEHVEAVTIAIREAAASAGRVLFAHLPVQFPVTAVAVDNYGQAK